MESYTVVDIVERKFLLRDGCMIIVLPADKKLIGGKMQMKNGEWMEFEIKCCKYLAGRLETLRNNIQKVVDKETENRIRRSVELSQYKTLEEAQEAYGFGEITPEEYDQILDILENGQKAAEEVRTVRSVAVEELNEYIAELCQIIKDCEWEMKSREEKRRILKSNEELKHRRMGGI